jgi:hypothetical protein
VTLVALLAICAHHTLTDRAFADGQRFEQQQNITLAAMAYALDRTSTRIRFQSPMERGKFLYDRASAVIGSAEINRYYDAAVDAFASVTGPTQSEVAEGLEWAAMALWYRHRFRGPIPRAEDYLRRAIAIRQRTTPVNEEVISTSIELLAGLLTDRGLAEQDQGALAEAKLWNDKLLSKTFPNGLRDPFALERCGDIAAGQKQWATAEACYKEGYSAWQQSPGGDLSQCAEKLVPVLQAQKKVAEAEIWKKKIPKRRLRI